MSKVRTLINSFAAGILSPRLDGRVDLDVYRKGARALTNWIPWPLGAAQNRSGSKYIARTKNDGQARLIPFILGQNEEYAIEVGNEYMRFYENGAQILDQLDFVAVGDDNGTNAYIVTALNGTEWITRNTNKSFDLNAITWSNALSLFCAVGDADGADAYLITSPDGIVWTEQSNSDSRNLFGIAYGNSKFVAVGNPDGARAYITTSPDGTTWTKALYSSPKNITLNAVAWSEALGLFCAVGNADGADAYILTSPDGTTWTERSNTKNFDLNGVAWSPSLALFVAVGNADGADAYIVYSSDGITWAEASNTKNFNLDGIEWSADLSLFVAVGAADGTDAYILTSSNGTTWTERANPKNFGLLDITWSSDSSLFVAVGAADGTDAYMITSADGTTWEEQNNLQNLQLNGIVSRGQATPAIIASPYLTAELYDIQFETKGNVMYLTHENHAVRQLTRIDTAGNEWNISVGGRMVLDEFIMFQEPLADFSVSPSATITINDVDTGINEFAEIVADATVFKSGDLGKKIKAGSGEAFIFAIIVDDTSPVPATSTSVIVNILSTFDAASYASGDWEMIGGGNFQLTPSATGTVRGFIDLTNATAVVLSLYLVNTGRAWTASGSGTNEYWLNNADAFFGEPDEILEKGVLMYKDNSAIGSLGVYQWGWGDNDAIGYNTIYVRLSDGVDPDTYLPGSGNPSRRHWLTMLSTVVTPVTTAAGDSTLASEVGGFVEINGGLVEILSNVSTRVYRGKVIKVLDSTDASVTWFLKGKAFSATNGYPGAIAIHEDRLYLAGTDEYPLTFWGSAVGDYDNFIPGTNDSDSVSFTLNAKEASKIVWLVSRDILIAGTEGGEWQVGLRGSITTPSNIYARRQTPHGSDIRYPIVAQSNILFVERGNRKLRELTYAFDNDSYKAPDRLLQAEHLSVDLIKQLAYQPRNNSIVWGMLESGEVIGMAYEPDFEVFAWFTMATGMTLAGAYDGTDDIESITVISDSSGVKELWATVLRTVNAGNIRTVEVFKNLFDSDTASNARMLDSHVVATGAGSTVTGLTHLIGDAVTFIIDGDSTKIGTAVVDADGEIDVSGTGTAATNIVAGIPYTSTLQTMRLEGGGERGSSQSKKKRAWEVILRLYRSMKGKLGMTSTISKLTSIPNVATLTSADRNTKVQQGFDTDGIVTVVQDEPLPITISMMQPEIQENERT
jgi:hypothetical protein